MGDRRILTGELPPPYPAGEFAESVANWTLFGMLGFVVLAPLLTVDPTNAAGQGNFVRQAVYILVFCLSLITAEITKFPERLVSPPRSILAVLAWCCLSMAWAVDLGVGARRLTLTSIVIFSIFLLVQRVGYEKTVSIVRWLLPVILLANYVAVLGWPGWAIHQAATTEDPNIVGAWRGILMHKNFAGPICAFTIIFYALDGRRIQAALRLLVLVAATYFLYRTHSKTSIGFVFGSIVMGMLFTIYNPYFRIVAAVFLTLAAALAGLWAYLNWGYLTAPFHDPAFLSGRVQIWPILLEYSKDHLFLGSGYGAFWNVGNPQPIYQYTDGWVTEIMTGHNGYIDILVQTGIPGLVLAISAAIIVPMRTFFSNLSLDRSRGSLLLACILFSACHNLTESSLFVTDASPEVFLMLAIALLGLEARAKPRMPLTATALLG